MSELVRYAEIKKEIPPGTVEAKLPEAVGILAVREAWIFRDQQGAIGDVMLEEISSNGTATRRFDVKGYAAFDAILREGLETTGHAEEELDNGIDRETVSGVQPPFGSRHDRLWFELIERMLNGLDLRQEHGSDARVNQLRMTLVATARILVSVASVRERPGSVSEGTVKAAKKVIADHDERTKHGSDGAGIEGTLAGDDSRGNGKER